MLWRPCCIDGMLKEERSSNMNVRGTLRRIGIVCIFMAVLIACAIPVSADVPTRRFDYKSKIYASRIKNLDYEIYMAEKYPGCTVLSAKSSNNKVLKIQSAGYVSVYFRPKKTGTATIKIKLITANGKKKTVKAKIKLYKFKKPFKSLTVDGKKLSVRKEDGVYVAQMTTANESVKASVQLAKGWKVKSVTRFEYANVNNQNSKKYNISNLPVDRRYCDYVIHLVDKKTKVEETISLSISKW